MSATVQSPRPPPSLGLLGVRSHLLLSGWVTVSGSCRSGAPGVGFLQPRMRQVIVQGGLGGPCVVLGRVGQSPGPFVTLALEAQTSVLGGLAGPPPGSLAARRPRVTCPGPAGPGVQRPGSSARGPRVRPVTPLPPGQRPHRTTASDQVPGGRRGLCCGPLISVLCSTGALCLRSCVKYPGVSREELALSLQRCPGTALSGGPRAPGAAPCWPRPGPELCGAVTVGTPAPPGAAGRSALGPASTRSECGL